MTAPNTPPLGEKVAIGAGIVAILGGVFAAIVWLWRRVDGWLVETHRRYGERAFAAELARGARHEKEIEAMQRNEARTFEAVNDLRVDFETHAGRMEKKLDEFGVEMREVFRSLGTVEGAVRRDTAPRSRFNDLTPESDAL